MNETTTSADEIASLLEKTFKRQCADVQKRIDAAEEAQKTFEEIESLAEKIVNMNPTYSAVNCVAMIIEKAAFDGKFVAKYAAIDARAELKTIVGERNERR